MARLELAEGNAQAALARIDALMEDGLQTEDVQLLRGDALLATGQIESARSLFSDMADQGSRSGTTRYAMSLARTQDFSGASEVLNDWLNDNPDDKEIMMLLANVGIQQGDQAKAKRYYEAMMPTSDPVVLNNLAWIYMDENDPRALDVARRANDTLPNNADIMDTLGWILVEKGEVREGLDLLRNSARMKPEDPTVQYHLGVAYYRSGDAANAKRALQRALANAATVPFTDETDARRILQSL